MINKLFLFAVLILSLSFIVFFSGCVTTNNNNNTVENNKNNFVQIPNDENIYYMLDNNVDFFANSKNANKIVFCYMDSNENPANSRVASVYLSKDKIYGLRYTEHGVIEGIITQESNCNRQDFNEIICEDITDYSLQVKKATVYLNRLYDQYKDKITGMVTYVYDFNFECKWLDYNSSYFEFIK